MDDDADDERDPEEGNPLIMGEAFAPPVKPPAQKDESVPLYLVKKAKQRLYDQTHECLVACAVIVVILGGCVVSYVYCQACLLGILVFSACLCPWIPYFNVPLWVSIVMLVSLGWHFTAGRLTLTWQ
jgi:hypothetical protein